MDYIEATQAIPLSDCEDGSDTDDETGALSEKKLVAHLKVLCQQGFPETLFPVFEGTNLIGRHDSCNIKIPLKALSKEHACIEIRAGIHIIFDKGSRNKTRRSKLFLTPEVRYEVKDGDRLRFGDANCIYIVEPEPKQQGGESGDETGSETGSEAGSESMLSQDPRATPVNHVTHTGEHGNEDEDKVNEPSSDLIQPTQTFEVEESGPVKTGRLLVPDETSLAFESDSEEDIIAPIGRLFPKIPTLVGETPTKDQEESMWLLDSGSDSDMFNTSRPEAIQDTLLYDDTIAETQGDDSLVCAATQRYPAMGSKPDEDFVPDSMGFDDSAVVPGDLAATQAYGINLDDEDETDDEGTGEGTKTRIEETIPDTMDMDTEEQHEHMVAKPMIYSEMHVPEQTENPSLVTHEASSSERGNSNGRKTAGNDDPSKVSSDAGDPSDTNTNAGDVSNANTNTDNLENTNTSANNLANTNTNADSLANANANADNLANANANADNLAKAITTASSEASVEMSEIRKEESILHLDGVSTLAFDDSFSDEEADSPPKIVGLKRKQDSGTEKGCGLVTAQEGEHTQVFDNDKNTQLFDNEEEGTQVFDNEEEGTQVFDNEEEGTQVFDNDDKGTQVFDDTEVFDGSSKRTKNDPLGQEDDHATQVFIGEGDTVAVDTVSMTTLPDNDQGSSNAKFTAQHEDEATQLFEKEGDNIVLDGGDQATQVFPSQENHTQVFQDDNVATQVFEDDPEPTLYLETTLEYDYRDSPIKKVLATPSPKSKPSQKESLGDPAAAQILEEEVAPNLVAVVSPVTPSRGTQQTRSNQKAVCLLDATQVITDCLDSTQVVSEETPTLVVSSRKGKGRGKRSTRFDTPVHPLEATQVISGDLDTPRAVSIETEASATPTLVIRSVPTPLKTNKRSIQPVDLLEATQVVADDVEGTQLVGTEFETPTLVVHSRTRTARSGVQPVDPLEATQVMGDDLDATQVVSAEPETPTLVVSSRQSLRTSTVDPLEATQVVADELDATQVVSAEPETPTLVVSSRQSLRTRTARSSVQPVDPLEATQVVADYLDATQVVSAEPETPTLVVSSRQSLRTRTARSSVQPVDPLEATQVVTDELDATQVVSAEPETPTLVVSSHQSRQTRTVQTSVQPVDPLEVTQVVDDELDITQVVSAEPETPTLVVSSRQQTRTPRSSVQPVDSLQATQVVADDLDATQVVSAEPKTPTLVVSSRQSLRTRTARSSVQPVDPLEVEATQVVDDELDATQVVSAEPETPTLVVSSRQSLRTRTARSSVRPVDPLEATQVVADELDATQVVSAEPETTTLVVSSRQSLRTRTARSSVQPVDPLEATQVVTDELDATQVVSAEPETPTLVVSSHQSRHTRTVRTSVQPVNPLEVTQVVDDELDVTQVVSAEPETPTLVVSSRQSLRTRTARSSVQPVDPLEATQVVADELDATQVVSAEPETPTLVVSSRQSLRTRTARSSVQPVDPLEATQVVTDELDATQVVSAEPETPTLVVSSHHSRQTRTVRTSVQPVDPLEVTQVVDDELDATQVVSAEPETPTLVVSSRQSLRTRTARSSVRPVDPLEATQVVDDELDATQVVSAEPETPTLVVSSRQSLRTRTARSSVQPVDPLEATQVVTDELDATQVVSAEPETPTLMVSSHQSRQTRTVRSSVQPVDPLEVTQVVDDELDMTQVVSAEPETPTLVVSSRQQTRTARSSVQPVDSLQATQVVADDLDATQVVSAEPKTPTLVVSSRQSLRTRTAKSSVQPVDPLEATQKLEGVFKGVGHIVEEKMVEPSVGTEDQDQGVAVKSNAGKTLVVGDLEATQAYEDDEEMEAAAPGDVEATQPYEDEGEHGEDLAIVDGATRVPAAVSEDDQLVPCSSKKMPTGTIEKQHKAASDHAEPRKKSQELPDHETSRRSKRTYASKTLPEDDEKPKKSKREKPSGPSTGHSQDSDSTVAGTGVEVKSARNTRGCQSTALSKSADNREGSRKPKEQVLTEEASTSQRTSTKKLRGCKSIYAKKSVENSETTKEEEPKDEGVASTGAGSRSRRGRPRKVPEHNEIPEEPGSTEEANPLQTATMRRGKGRQSTDTRSKENNPRIKKDTMEDNLEKETSSTLPGASAGTDKGNQSNSEAAATINVQVNKALEEAESEEVEQEKKEDTHSGRSRRSARGINIKSDESEVQPSSSTRRRGKNSRQSSQEGTSDEKVTKEAKVDIKISVSGPAEESQRRKSSRSRRNQAANAEDNNEKVPESVRSLRDHTVPHLPTVIEEERHEQINIIPIKSTKQKPEVSNTKHKTKDTWLEHSKDPDPAPMGSRTIRGRSVKDTKPHPEDAHSAGYSKSGSLDNSKNSRSKDKTEETLQKKPSTRCRKAQKTGSKHHDEDEDETQASSQSRSSQRGQESEEINDSNAFSESSLISASMMSRCRKRKAAPDIREDNALASSSEKSGPSNPKECPEESQYSLQLITGSSLQPRQTRGRKRQAEDSTVVSEASNGKVSQPATRSTRGRLSKNKPDTSQKTTLPTGVKSKIKEEPVSDTESVSAEASTRRTRQSRSRSSGTEDKPSTASRYQGRSSRTTNKVPEAASVKEEPNSSQRGRKRKAQNKRNEEDGETLLSVPPPKGHRNSQSSASSQGESSRPSEKRRRGARGTSPSSSVLSQQTPKEEPGTPSLRKRHDKPRIMFTGVTDDAAQKARVRIVNELGGEMVDSIYDCTHLITDKVRRTVKLLCGLARGILIVDTRWLNDCHSAQMFVDASDHIIKDEGSEALFKFRLDKSIHRALQAPMLQGYKVHVTQNVKPDPKQMKDIIQCAGGEYLASMPKRAESGVVVVSCTEDKGVCKPAIAAGVPVVSSEFLLTGVLQQFVNVEAYTLYNEEGAANSGSGASQSKRRKR